MVFSKATNFVAMSKIANVLIYGDIAAHDPEEAGRVTVGLNDVKAQLARQGKFEVVNVHIRTRGGEVEEGDKIYDYFQELGSNGIVVNTIGEGLVASIGTKVIQSACKGGTRQMERVSEFFIHNPHGEIKGEHKDVEAYALQLKEAEESLLSFYVTKTQGKADKDKLRALMAEQTSFTPAQALELGFIDEIIEPKVYAILKKEENNLTQIVLEMKKEIMALVDKFKPKAKIKALHSALEDGTELYIETEADAPKVGDMVYIGSDNTGEKAPNGEHTLTGDLAGFRIVTADGAISEVYAPSEYTMAEMEAKVAELEAKLTEKEDIENALVEADKAVAEKEEIIAEQEKAILALKASVKSDYVPKARQKEVMARHPDTKDKKEGNRVADGIERHKTATKPGKLTDLINSKK